MSKVNMNINPEIYFENKAKDFAIKLYNDLRKGDLTDNVFDLITSEDFRKSDTFEQARKIALLLEGIEMIKKQKNQNESHAADAVGLSDLLAEKIATDLMTSGVYGECERIQLMKKFDGKEVDGGGRNKQSIIDEILKHLDG